MTVVLQTDYTRACRGVAQLVAHRVWDAGVGGSSPPTPTYHFRYQNNMSIKSSKVDLIIEAARYKSNGQVDKVRAYMRRGPTFSDCIILSRHELISNIQNGNKVATGQRIPGLASTFKDLVPLNLFPKGDHVLITSYGHFAEQDLLDDIPVL